ncbi:MAG: T9SS type A sorting domain-containing protein [bacterium]|nr:T9SS type A sorting domain-containing protein [bacterium]
MDRRWLIVVVLLLPITLFAQDFPYQQEYNTIPVEIDGWQPFQPWSFGLSESIPEFCDIDADGDFDAFVGVFWGTITFFQNTGTNQMPIFSLITSQYAGIDIHAQPWYGRPGPSFGDLDADNDYDLVFGDGNGYVHYYRNDGTAQEANFVRVTDLLLDTTYWCCHAKLVDLDADGDLDIIGGNNATVSYFQNTGSPQQFNFIPITGQLQNINVGQFANPSVCDIDEDGDYDLFIGERFGHIRYYRNDGTPQQYSFTLVSSNWLGIDVGDFSAPEFCDIDGDGDYDLFVGREPNLGDPTHGDVFFYENVGTAQNPSFQFITTNYLTADVGNNNIEQYLDIDADGDLDLLVGCGSHLQLYRNTGNAQNPAFSLEDTAFAGIDLIDIQPFFCDIDNDGDYDLFAGTTAIPGPPGMRLYLNQGTPQHPHFVLYSGNFVPGDYWVIITPTLADIDGDGDLDLFITDHQGHYFYYENTGTPQWPTFQFVTNNWQSLGGGAQLHRFLHFYDIDQDGDLDLFFFNNWNESGGDNLRYYRNQGTAQNPQMILVTPTYLPFEVITAYPWFCDIDSDSLTDLFVSDGYGGIMFFHGVDTTGVAPFNPHSIPKDISLSLFPNPTNAGAVVRFTLPGAGLVRVELFDVEGRLLTGACHAPLQESWFPAGTHDLRLDAKDLPSGVYLIRLDAGQQRVTGKVVILK